MYVTYLIALNSVKACCIKWELPSALLNLDGSSRGLNTRNSSIDSLKQRKIDSLLLSAAYGGLESAKNLQQGVRKCLRNW